MGPSGGKLCGRGGLYAGGVAPLSGHHGMIGAALAPIDDVMM